MPNNVYSNKENTIIKQISTKYLNNEKGRHLRIFIKNTDAYIIGYLIKISKRNIFCKGGAEGVFLFVHLKKGIFGILKVKDGNERALSSAMYTLLKKFKILTRKELNQFNSWNTTNMYNHAKIKIGSISTKIE